VANTIKINNRVIQKQIETYKSKSEISEALFLLREYLNESTHKWLSHFLHTNGATQAKISTICDLSGVPRSTFYAIVKPEIENFFLEPLIKKLAAPKKLDHSRSKKVRASEFKILQPLKKIKYLIAKFCQAERLEIAEIRDELFFIPGLDHGPNHGPESNPESPCQTAPEDEKSCKQKKAFRENPLEKHNNIFNSPENISKSAPRKIKIKTEIKNYLENFPVFRDFTTWSDSKRYDIARTLQLAVIKTKTDIQETSIQFVIKNAVARLMAEYQDKPLSEFLKLLYTFVFNALNNDQEDDSEAPEDIVEEPAPNLSKQAAYWEKMKPTLQHMLDNPPIDPRPRQERVDEINRMLEELNGPGASKDELDDLGVY